MSDAWDERSEAARLKEGLPVGWYGSRQRYDYDGGVTVWLRDGRGNEVEVKLTKEEVKGDG